MQLTDSFIGVLDENKLSTQAGGDAPINRDASSCVPGHSALILSRFVGYGCVALYGVCGQPFL